MNPQSDGRLRTMSIFGAREKYCFYVQTLKSPCKSGPVRLNCHRSQLSDSRNRVRLPSCSFRFSFCSHPVKMFTRTVFNNKSSFLPVIVFLVACTSVAASGQVSGSSMQGKFPCLSTAINLRDKVKAGPSSVTLSQRLSQLGGRCRRGKLVDRKGREIRVFDGACWGNPPADYLEILEEQRKTLIEMKKRYTVIEILCDPRTASTYFAKPD
jgi:hypothetical protein